MKTVTKTQGSKRVYDKQHCCYFCNKMVAKIGRHYLGDQHKNEPLVERFLSLPKGKARQKELDRLRLMGNYYHNIKEIETGGSTGFIPVRRPSEREKLCLDDFVPCTHCLGFYKKDELYKHVQIYIFKTGLCSSHLMYG